MNRANYIHHPIPLLITQDISSTVWDLVSRLWFQSCYPTISALSVLVLESHNLDFAVLTLACNTYKTQLWLLNVLISNCNYCITKWLYASDSDCSM